MTDAQLVAAIQANPMALAQANAGNDSGCAATLSAALPPIPAAISTPNLMIWAVSRGVLTAVQSGTANSNAHVSSACMALMATIQGGASSLDLTNPVIAGDGGLIDSLATAGILPTNTDTTGTNPTQGCKADLLAFASVPQVITAAQVSHCLIPTRTGGGN